MLNTEKVGFIGLGKLGLPCAAAVSKVTGEKVLGFDLNNQVGDYIKQRKVPYMEKGIEDFLDESNVNFVDSIDEVVKECTLIFIAVQTPHEKDYEGISEVPSLKKDFDYSYLEEAAEQLNKSIVKLKKENVLVVVISTVLPGTMRSRILPKFEFYPNRMQFCYNPFFIAMGTTISDFLNPEFILIGSDEKKSAQRLAEFYTKVNHAESKIMKIESAELTKVAYNTFIGFKIVFANVLAEICDVRGGDSDEITSALASANVRLMSEKYLKAGMGDGGGCHPRDQIAMSWLSENANLSIDLFGFLATARDEQTKRQAEIIIKTAKNHELPIVILGQAYKPDINLTIGSPSILLGYFLEAQKIEFDYYDPIVNPESEEIKQKAVFFIGTNHTVFKSLILPKGSICIDPWGNAINDQDGVMLIKIGRI
jgi:UDPglucose 6-dehydrogenase